MAVIAGRRPDGELLALAVVLWSWCQMVACEGEPGYRAAMNYSLGGLMGVAISVGVEAPWWVTSIASGFIAGACLRAAESRKSMLNRRSAPA
jgi:hypothetical protein